MRKIDTQTRKDMKKKLEVKKQERDERSHGSRVKGCENMTVIESCNCI